MIKLIVVGLTPAELCCVFSFSQDCLQRDEQAKRAITSWVIAQRATLAARLQRVNIYKGPVSSHFARRAQGVCTHVFCIPSHANIDFLCNFIPRSVKTKSNI
jgi:hypothetical protein